MFSTEAIVNIFIFFAIDLYGDLSLAHDEKRVITFILPRTARKLYFQSTLECFRIAQFSLTKMPSQCGRKAKTE